MGSSAIPFFLSLRIGLRIVKGLCSEEHKSFRLYLDKSVFIEIEVVFTVVSSERGTKCTITLLLKETEFCGNAE